jgi:hypothetical protein
MPTVAWQTKTGESFPFIGSWEHDMDQLLSSSLNLRRVRPEIYIMQQTK